MFLAGYIYWHFAIAPGNILNILGNYTKATWHRFLIARHLKTLFVPWHKKQPSDISGVSGKIGNAVADFYIRILAAAVRLTIILAGLAAEAVISAAFILLLIVWVLWPVILVYSIGKGVSLLL